MPRRLLPLLLAVLAWATTACQLTVAAGIDVNRDGSGRVSAGLGLDADALKEVGDPSTALRLDDVRAAGWQVDQPSKEGDGLTWIRASKPFADPEQVPAILAELNAAGGPFKDFRVVRTKSLTRSKTTFTGTLDLAGGLTGFSDPELNTTLDDVDLGLDLEGLRRRFGDRLDVRVTAGLPGEVKTNAPAREGGRALWAPELGETVQMEASSEAFRVDPRIPITAGGALLILAVGIAVVVRRRRRARS